MIFVKLDLQNQISKNNSKLVTFLDWQAVARNSMLIKKGNIIHGS